MPVCEIHLDKIQHQYHPGDSITGTVTCLLREQQTVEDVQVCLQGLEQTSWQEDGTREYRDNKTFLQLKKIWTKEDMNAIGWDLRSGKLKYPFKFDLPHDLPGSYQGKYGRVKYGITANAVIGGVEYTAIERKTTIIALIDLNELDNLQLGPVCYSAEKVVCNWCFCSGFISMDVHLNKEAFVLGELVNVKVKIRNRTKYHDNFMIRAKIWMIVESNLGNPRSKSKLEYVLLAADSSEHRILADEHNMYEYNLQLPNSVELPNFTLCKLLRQFCKLEVTAILVSYYDEFKVEENIVVGHIPLGGQKQSQQTTLQENDYSPWRAKGITDSSAALPHPTNEPKHLSPQICDMPRPTSVSKPSPYPLNIPQPAGSNSAPYPPDTSFTKRGIHSVDDIKPVISYSLGTLAPYPPDKPKRPYPMGDNFAPYPREEHNSQDLYPPRTRTTQTYKESQKPTSYPPDKPNTAPYPSESPRFQDPYPTDIHTPPYPSYDKSTTERGISSSKTHKSVLLPVVMPMPYRPYQSNGSSTKDHHIKSKHYGCNTAPYPSVMPQPTDSPEKSIPPYPTSVPYSSIKLRASYPPCSDPTPYPSAMPKPEYSYLSHSAPYPLDTSKPPYSTGFKPSYSPQRQPVPYPLGKANHPHPSGKNYPPSNSKPPYPTSDAVPYPIPMPLKNTLPPRCDSIGFAVPTSANSSFESPDLPIQSSPVGRPLTSVQDTPSIHRPSAPSFENESVEDGVTTPLLEGNRHITPPPSYEDTVSSSIPEQLNKK